MACFENSAFDNHESVSFVHDAKTGLRAIVAIHSTALGPAAGGCRMWNYTDSDAALVDALRLSRGMSYKNALAGLAFGGGKAVILKQHDEKDREALFEAFGRAVESLGGRYITAEDVGVSVEDMQVIDRQTAFVSGLPPTSQGNVTGGDPSPKTARGCLHGIKAAAKSAMDRSDLEGLTVSVQGLGGVGFNLCKELNDAGARLKVADIDESAVSRVCDEFGALPSDVDIILFEETDVLSPCALGGIFNEATISKLNTAIVAGGANNQLLTDRDGERLMHRGILYAPDYVINAGGIINVAAEYSRSRSEDEVWDDITDVECRLLDIFSRSKSEKRATNLVADEMARQVLAQAHQASSN